MKMYLSIIKHWKYLGIIVMSALLFNSCEQSQAKASKTVSENKSKEIHTLVNQYVENGKFNGSVLVAKEGEIVFKSGYGFANVEWDKPNESNTKFRLASVSKQFTAMLIMQLVEKNTVNLHEPISKYLPNYPKEKGDQISIHQLLIHSAGVPEPDFDRKQNYNPDQLIDVFSDHELLFKPGEKFSYSNSGYILLGKIIENVTGKSYEEVLKEKIFVPLNMKHSGYDNHRDVIANKATGYNKFGGKYTYARFIDMSSPFSAGAIYSTVEDLFLWDRALYSDQLLPKVYMNLLFDGYIKESVNSYYGYGWSIGELFIGNTTESVKTIRHDGIINGFTSFIVRMPETQSLVVLLNNTGRAPLHQMTKDITGILFDVTYDFPKKSMANALVDVIKKKGIDKAMEFYKANEHSEVYYLNESEINVAAYDFLFLDKINEARELFELNIKAFPNAFNVYDSYGEFLMKQGNTPNAIEHYEKSLELNPNNRNAERMIAQLMSKC